MGSLAAEASATCLDAVDTAAAVPELNDANYSTHVLRLPPDRSEAWLEEELRAKALAQGLSLPSLPSPFDDDSPFTPQSASTATTINHARTFSSNSDRSTDTVLTAHSNASRPSTPAISKPEASPPRYGKSLNFSTYDKYLAQVGPTLDQPKICRASLLSDSSTPNLLSVTTRRSLFSLRSAVKNKVRRKRTSIFSPEPALLVAINLLAFPPSPFPPTCADHHLFRSCICCRDDFKQSGSLHNLPCGHTYCTECLRIMVDQATTDESKMPPRCCTQPIPSSIVKPLLSKDAQNAFLKAVVLFSTPWESRIFCPNATCGEFVPPRRKVDPKQPFNITCSACSTHICIMCKGNAHPMGKDCPEDTELDAVLRMGEKSGWRRCYKCRTLVELAQGCTHMTCRCKAQFCYICGGVWDTTVGCPNFCNGEEELERRRLEEEERLAELEAEKAAVETAKADAERRTNEHPEFQEVRQSQEEELARFRTFVSQVKESMRIRHHAQKRAIVEKHVNDKDKMDERHAKTVSHLEDRQIAAEMELRVSLEQSERSVKIRLKHMEAYCDGLAQSSDSNLPSRVVTERHLQELGHQYNIRDGIERLHQARINVMRDKQAKQMEELLDRQAAELEKLAEKQEGDLEDLAARFADEEDAIDNIFQGRRRRLTWRWQLVIMILCKELEERDKAPYALIPPPSWPLETELHQLTFPEEGTLTALEMRA
ncbi:putative E3 ubiquitin-protein ligase-like protein [Paramyrothecium foliicola]|nr:putative E3 ubiquitin-protein ligase-like protein [Paramyrothecium foliicola]